MRLLPASQQRRGAESAAFWVAWAASDRSVAVFPREAVLTPAQFAAAHGLHVKSLERWSDLPWSVVNGRTRFLVWGDWLDYLKARRR